MAGEEISVDVELRIIRKDGSIRWIHALNNDVEYQGRPAVLSTSMDITERKRVEEELKGSEARLKEAQQLAKIGYYELDLVANRITGSEGARRIFGLEPPDGAISQAQLEDVVHPDDRELHRRALEDALQGSRLYDVEYRIVRPDGDIRFVHVRDEIIKDESGKPIRIFGTVQDSTERKRAEEEVRRHAARMEALAEASRASAEAGLDYQRVLTTVARRTAELIGDACVISLFSDDAQRAYPVAYHHSDPRGTEMMREALLQTGQGGIDSRRYAVLLAGDSIFIPEVDPEQSRSSLQPEFIPFLESFGISSVVIVPLRLPGRVIGTLGLTRNRSGSPYTRDDLLLLQGLADRAALAIENARLYESVNEHRDRLRALSAQLVQAQEDERRRIARELHDEAGQFLTGLQIALEIDSRSASGAAKHHLDETRQLVGRLAERVQDLSLELRPATLDDLGLVPALLDHFDRYTRQTGIRVHFDHRGADRRFPPEVETAAYRIIQEGLTNVARHAQVLELAVHAWVDDGSLAVQIEDEGAGFDVETVMRAHTSSGLSGMQERAALLGGQVTIESARGKGTQITLELPLADRGGPAGHGHEDSAGG
jgi:PAS domain S-box-containing protein